MGLRRQLFVDYYVGTLLHFLLKPFCILLGKMLRRDHDLMKCSSVTVMKILGGGSLVIAYPALLALKRAPGITRLRLLTTPTLAPFAEALAVFDEIILIRDTSLVRMALDSLRALPKLFACDAIVDLEVHSRLTTVFAVLVCARNRVGFYTHDSFWRKRLSTHLLYCNVSSGVYYFYDQIAQLFGAPKPDEIHAQAVFRSRSEPVNGGFALAPCCSDISKERMLRVDEWVWILQHRLGHENHVELHLLGAPSERATLAALADAIHLALPNATAVNHAGCSLEESLRILLSVRQLFCIDSALMHFARLLGIPTVSFWGPTDPKSLLRLFPDSQDEIHYYPLPCSPCIHMSQQAPCQGNNICMRLAVIPEWPANRNPPWIVANDRVKRFERPSGP